MKTHSTTTRMPTVLMLTGVFKHYSSIESTAIFTYFKTTVREIHEQQGQKGLRQNLGLIPKHILPSTVTFYHDSNILLDLFAKLDLTLLNKGCVLQDQ